MKDFDFCDTYIRKEDIVRDFGVFDDPDTLPKNHGQTMDFSKNAPFAFSEFDDPDTLLKNHG